MPKSTIVHGPPSLLVARDRVDEPVGPDLARVVVADRHPGLEPGADDADVAVEVALAHRRPLRPQLRHRRGDDHPVEHLEVHAAQREQVAQHRAQLVGGRLAHGGEAPVLDELPVAERAEVGLRVAGVDDEEHGRGTLDSRRRGRDPLRRPRIASVRLRGASAPAQGDRVPPRRHAAGRAQGRSRRRCSGGSTVPGLVLDGREDPRLAPRSCARSTSRCPSRRCCRPTRRSASRSSWPRAGATRCCSRSCGASLWAALRRAPAAIPSYSEGSTLPIPAPLARLSAPLVALRRAAHQPRLRPQRPRRPRAPRQPPRAHRPLDRARRDRRRAAERRRPPDRRGPARCC